METLGCGGGYGWSQIIRSATSFPRVRPQITGGKMRAEKACDIFLNRIADSVATIGDELLRTKEALLIALDAIIQCRPAQSAVYKPP